MLPNFTFSCISTLQNSALSQIGEPSWVWGLFWKSYAISMSLALSLKVSFRGIFSLTGSLVSVLANLDVWRSSNKLEISFLEMFEQTANFLVCIRSSRTQYSQVQLIIFIAFRYIQIPVVASPAKTRRITEAFPRTQNLLKFSQPWWGCSAKLWAPQKCSDSTAQSSPCTKKPVKLWISSWTLSPHGHKETKHEISRTIQPVHQQLLSQEFSWPLHWAAEHSRCWCIITSHWSAASIAERSWNDLGKLGRHGANCRDLQDPLYRFI